jgi:hypothetical protein
MHEMSDDAVDVGICVSSEDRCRCRCALVFDGWVSQCHTSHMVGLWEVAQRQRHSTSIGVTRVRYMMQSQ